MKPRPPNFRRLKNERRKTEKRLQSLFIHKGKPKIHNFLRLFDDAFTMHTDKYTRSVSGLKSGLLKKLQQPQKITIDAAAAIDRQLLMISSNGSNDVIVDCVQMWHGMWHLSLQKGRQHIPTYCVGVVAA